tara:strand:- start:645 stop:881 length:237 start_codon:yes stop_codon:yes gene_type:complete
MNQPKTIEGRELKKFVPSKKRDNSSSVEVELSVDPYGKVQSQLKQLELCGTDIKTLPLLKNNRGFLISLNDGSFIYTE